ncbi:MAG TPA: alpha/beta fold hydrolase [Candidatus Competibacteraceae bacterium]|nr:alpha/beta fold hydrolase [Candidatus Competibacteraceae bacterium]
MHRGRPILLVLAILFLIAFNPAPAQTTFGQEKEIEVLGQHLHYVEAGSGPTVVLLHGLGADYTTWLPILPVLAPYFHVYALDQLGFGQSDKPMIPYRPRTLVDFLTGFLDQLGIEKATLVGSSLGGWTAAAFTLDHPARVDKLVLVGAAGLAPRLWNGPTWDRAWLEQLNPSTLAGYRQLLGLAFYHKQLLTDDFITQQFARKLKINDGYTISRFLESFEHGEDLLDERLKTLKVPTLVLWGAEDELTPLDSGKALAAIIPGAQLTIVDRCGHILQNDCPEAFNGALLKFLGASGQ